MFNEVYAPSAKPVFYRTYSRGKKGNPIPGWRLFRVDKIFTYNVLMDKFTEMRPFFNPNGDKRMSRIIKIAEFGNE